MTAAPTRSWFWTDSKRLLESCALEATGEGGEGACGDAEVAAPEPEGGGVPGHRLPPRRQRRAVLPHLRAQLEVRVQLCPNTEALSFQHYTTVFSRHQQVSQGRTSRSEVGLALSARFLLALAEECNPDSQQ